MIYCNRITNFIFEEVWCNRSTIPKCSPNSASLRIHFFFLKNMWICITLDATICLRVHWGGIKIYCCPINFFVFQHPIDKREMLEMVCNFQTVVLIEFCKVTDADWVLIFDASLLSKSSKVVNNVEIDVFVTSCTLSLTPIIFSWCCFITSRTKLLNFLKLSYVNYVGGWHRPNFVRVSFNVTVKWLPIFIKKLHANHSLLNAPCLFRIVCRWHVNSFIKQKWRGIRIL